MIESAKKKACQKSIFKIFCFNNSGTRKIKDLQKDSSNKTRVNLQSDNTKHKHFQFIPWSNFIDRLQILSPGIGGKVLIE